MKKAELLFVPSPGRGHLVSMVEFAKTLIARDDRFYITIIIIKLPFDSKLSAYTDSLVSSSTSDRIKFIDLTGQDHSAISETHPLLFMDLLTENKKPLVRNAVAAHLESNTGPDSPRLAGFLIDMLMTSMIDVANEFKVPTYVFFTSSAGFLGLKLHIQALQDDKDGEKSMDPTRLSQDSDAEFVVPCFLKPVSTGALPGVFFDEPSTALVVNYARKIRKTRGVILNTFMELECHAIQSLLHDSESPPLYSVGPIVTPNDDSSEFLSGQQYSDIIHWLDEQPHSSVVFLCFGSTGSFSEDQLKEIARGIEQSGHHFLWSIRQPPPKNKLGFPRDFEDPRDVLPEGFVDRTASRGKIISWAPQVAILAHPAVGGFVSHCGWNSILESLWFGVPIATWPLTSEQQLNAFEMVKELGLAVAITLDYRMAGFYCRKAAQDMVRAEEVEKGVRKLMDVASDNELRKRVKEMSEMSRKALAATGSSYSSLSGLIGDIIDNLP